MKHVLIVEDDAWLAECYVAWLKKDYKVTVKQSCQDALNELDDNKADLVILDLMLPEHSGVQLLQEFKSHTDLNKIPVLICSAAYLSDVKSSLISGGAFGVMDKTRLSPQLLRAKVAEAINANN